MLYELSEDEILYNIKNIFYQYDKIHANILIPGGSIIRLLDQEFFDTFNSSNWNFYFTDERCDRDHLNSNEASVFLKRVPNASVNVIQISDSCTYEECAKKYESIIKNVRINIALLGIGENGHTCSIWPNSESIKSENKVVYTEVDDIYPKRITITPKFINENIDEVNFIIPKKNGNPKKISKPDLSILSAINVPYKIYKSVQ